MVRRATSGSQTANASATAFGTPSPRVPRLEFDANGQVALDEFGNAKGGSGFLLREDAADLMARVERSAIPSRGVRSPLPTHLVPEPV